MPKPGAQITCMRDGKYVCMMHAVHILLMSASSLLPVVEPCTCLDDLTLDCSSFVLQQLKGPEDSRVRRQPVLVLGRVLPLTSVSTRKT